MKRSDQNTERAEEKQNEAGEEGGEHAWMIDRLKACGVRQTRCSLDPTKKAAFFVSSSLNTAICQSSDSSSF